MARFRDNFLDGLYDIDRDIYLEQGLNFTSSEEETAIFFYCHCLPSFAELIKYMVLGSGFDPKKIFGLPKKYSTTLQSVEEIKSLGVEICEDDFEFPSGHYDRYAVDAIKAFIVCAGKSLVKNRDSVKRVILIDDGGFLTRHWCRNDFSEIFDTISVQQTASGIYLADDETTIPKIDIARSAAKREFEAKIIALGVVRKVLQSVDLKEKKVGIAGLGAIGSALSLAIKNVGVREILLYDRIADRSKSAASNVESKIVGSANELIREADVVFGCTGFNFCHKVNLETIVGKKEFYSCSSRDKEFLSLLQHSTAIEGNDFSSIKLGKNANLIVHNGGFPINFDREREWEEPNEILIIRNLVLASIYQAMTIPYAPKNETRRHHWEWANVYWKIEPSVQKYIVEKWYNNLNEDMQSQFLNPEKLPLQWWEENSAGETASKFMDKKEQV